MGGTGLGLSIAAEDAALQQGYLEVASRPGHGALFVLTLPSGESNVGDRRPVPVDVDAFDASTWGAGPGTTRTGAS
jgi:two-component system sensor histidine kinase MtrB